VSGVLVLPGTAPRGEWLAARRGGVTASEIAVIMGLAPPRWGSAYQLYHQKTGELPEDEDTDLYSLRRFMEPYVAARYLERFPHLTVSGDGRDLYAHPQRPWQMATPDRLVQDDASLGVVERDGVFDIENLAALELKTSASRDGWGDDGSDIVPVCYRCQVLWQMDVLGVPAGAIACLFLPSGELRCYDFEMDAGAAADLEVMRTAALAFLRRIERGKPPEIDWRRATTAALRVLNPGLEDRETRIPAGLARRYRAACKAGDAAGRRKDEAANQIRDRLAGGRYAVDPAGARILTRSVYTERRVSAALVRERYPEVARDCTVESTVDKLIPAKTREAP
jgi:putative phage-type endonuclease